MLLKNPSLWAKYLFHNATPSLHYEQLAEQVGVTRQAIGMIDAGNYNPSLKLCVAICKCLNRTIVANKLLNGIPIILNKNSYKKGIKSLGISICLSIFQASY